MAVQLLHEMGAVEEPRQGVQLREFDQACLGLLAQRDVGHDAGVPEAVGIGVAVHDQANGQGPRVRAAQPDVAFPVAVNDQMVLDGGGERGAALVQHVPERQFGRRAAFKTHHAQGRRIGELELQFRRHDQHRFRGVEQGQVVVDHAVWIVVSPSRWR